MRGKLAVATVGALLVIATIAGGGTAQAVTTRTWTGAIDLTWNTAGNWSPSGVPANGDSVVIGAPANGQTLNNNIPVGLVLDSLTISANTTIKGNELGIVSTISTTVIGSDVTLDLPIKLNGNVAAHVATDGRVFMRDRLTPEGVIALKTNGFRLTKTGGDVMEFNGDITGTGEVRDSSGGLSLLVPVTFTGTISASAAGRILLSTYPFRDPITCGSAPQAKFVLTNAELALVCSSSIGPLSGTGTLTMLFDNARLSMSGGGIGAVFNGEISGAAPSVITCCSNGGQYLKGNSTYSGLIFVNDGALYLGGATFPPAAQFTVQGDADTRPALVGYGSFGETIITAGNLELTPIDGAFGLARFPTLQLAPSDLVDFEIQGPTPGSGFTQVVMTGEVFLDSARLMLEFGYRPDAGQSFTLIKGASDLFDTFHDTPSGANLPEGATFPVPGPQRDSGPTQMIFKITYKGGLGHDVVITRQADPPPPLLKRFLSMVARDN